MERRSEAVNAIRDLQKKIDDVRATVVRDAKVIGATTSKAYLSHKEMGRFDVVILDEASMIQMPALWFVAGMAKERVVVCGDHRQLPSIVTTKQKAIFNVLGRDVFEITGADRHADRRVTLEMQYRMVDPICQLVSGPMYEGVLKTGRPDEPPKVAFPEPLESPLLLIDTSDIWPYQNRTATGSRFNIMHALIARNLIWHLNEKGAIASRNDLGLATPYASQSKLVQKLLDADGLGEYSAATVHKLQGDERETILFDTVDSIGEPKYASIYLQSIAREDEGAKQINVAITRAKQRMILIANVTHLDRVMPQHAIMRDVIYAMQENGRTIPSARILNLRPVERDLLDLNMSAIPEIELKDRGFCNERQFVAALEQDIANAKESIIVYSGFITPARVAALGDLLRARIAAGVKVRCITRGPKTNGSMPLEMTGAALDSLEAMGVIVDTQNNTHEKAVIIDGKISWYGSLNPLSHAGHSSETMMRVRSREYAGVLLAHLRGGNESPDRALAKSCEAENPRCVECGGRTTHITGRNKSGPYDFFACEDEACGRTVDARQRGSGTTRSDLPKNGPVCADCGAPTALKSGRRGPFYGCTKYPDCRYTTGIEQNAA